MQDNVVSDEEEERNGGGNDDSDEEQFDISLAASHSYMGNGLVSVSGRSVLEAGWTGRVPAAAHHGAVFPGETVPMVLTDQHDAAVIVRAIKLNKLFGLLCPDETGTLVSGYGVLCEVFEVAGAGEDAPSTLSFKARATHRFRCVRMPKYSMPINLYSRMHTVEVRVLPEVRLGEPLRHVRLASLDPLRRGELGGRLQRMDAVVTPWPLFVYDVFDYRRMRRIIEDHFRSMALDKLPEEAVSLSFWTASNLALSARDRLALFVVDDALLRLHMEVRLITRKSVLCCASCATVIARREHMFAMSSEGVHSNYTNVGGFVHDIVTVSRASNTAPRGAPSAEFSWFPGYVWTVVLCSSCTAHVGWRFDALRRVLRPQHFYGLCRNYVQPRCDGDVLAVDEEPASGDHVYAVRNSASEAALAVRNSAPEDFPVVRNSASEELPAVRDFASDESPAVRNFASGESPGPEESVSAELPAVGNSTSAESSAVGGSASGDSPAVGETAANTRAPSSPW